MVAFLYYEPIKPFKSYAPLAQLVEQLTLNFAWTNVVLAPGLHW